MPDRTIHELLIQQFIRFTDPSNPNQKLTKGSHAFAEFKCINCHRIFPSRIKDLNNNLYRGSDRKTTGCPYCAGKKVCHELSFGAKFPWLLRFWNYEKNGGITPFQILPGSEEKFWFTCLNNHDFASQLFNITKKTNPRWCPKCKLRGTSRLEIILFTEISSIFGESKVIWQKQNDYSKSHFRVECDILIEIAPQNYIAIELDSSLHKSLKGKERDLNKNRILQKINIPLFRIRNTRLDRLSPEDIFFSDEEPAKDIVSRFLLNLKNYLILNESICEKIQQYVAQENLASEAKFIEYHHKLLSHSDLKGGLSKERPDLVSYWHPTKNLPYTLENFNKGSRFKAFWICYVCNFEEILPIKEKVKRAHHCSNCFKISRKTATFQDSLAFSFPKLLEAWDYKKNTERGLNPEQLNPWSEEMAFWKCEIGHAYERSIKAITYAHKNGYPGCLDCKHKRNILDTDGKYISAAQLSKKIKKEHEGSGPNLTLILDLLSKGASSMDLYAYAKLTRGEKLVLNLPKSLNPHIDLERFIKSLVISTLAEKICPLIDILRKTVEKCGGNLSLAEKQLGLRKGYISDYLRKNKCTLFQAPQPKIEQLLFTIE